MNDKIKNSILQSLKTSGQFTPQEHEAIAQAVIAALYELLQDGKFKEQMSNLAYQAISTVIKSKH